MTTAAALTASTGRLIMTSTRMLRPRWRSASRQAMRRAGRQPLTGRPPRRAAASGSSAPVSSTTTPSRRKTTRSAQAACRASWVTITPAAPASQRARSSRRISSPVSVSSAPVGSSARISRRSPTMARAIATRCCWPPDISSGKRSARSAMPTSSSAVSASRRAIFDLLAVELAGQGDVLGGGQRGDQVEVLEDVAHRRTPDARAPGVVERGEVGALDPDRAGRSGRRGRRRGSAGSTCRSRTAP